MWTSLRQFRLICWKNFIFLKERILLTVIQLFLPVVFIFILFGLRQTIGPVEYPEKSYQYINFGYSKIFFKSSQLNRDWGIGYISETSDTNDLTNYIVKNLKEKLRNKDETKFRDPINAGNYSNFLSYYEKNNTIMQQTFVLLLVNNVTQKMRGSDVEYTLRFPAEQHWKGGDRNDWLTEKWYSSELMGSPRSDRKLGHITTPGYYREGFVLLQTIIDDAIIKWQYKKGLPANSDLPDVPLRITNFPYPSYFSDDYTTIIKFYMPLFIMVCFVVNVTLITVDVALEKEKKLKESMRLMGLKVWVNWVAWFLNHLLLMCFSVLLMTLFFHLKTQQSSVFRLTDPSVTFVFLLLFSISVIMFAFLMASIFAKANSAAAATAIIYLLSYVPYYFIQVFYNGVSFPAKIILCLFNNIAMSFGCMQISKLETIGLGMQWSNMGDTYLAQEELTMSTVMIMLVVDIVLYALLTAYFDALFPGEFGVPLPFYFPFTKSYWCGPTILEADPNEADAISEQFEKLDKNKKVGVRIRGLTKIFSNDSTPAVDNISIDVNEGNITAFLGHNGAGKTTTMFMLTGFIKPTRGSVHINGYDISMQMNKVRKTLGLCPQHNILFNKLTVSQHLVFFATLKGRTDIEAKDEAKEMITHVGLENKEHCKAIYLSGGMKRKLSIAIALIGGSKFVILDEPTSGMDPQSRRQTWELLKNVRGGRSIILSTHFMDEADYLGDRIAIMNSGKIKCYGTSMFLKNKYGIGYHLTITKGLSCKPKVITDLILGHVNNAKFESELGTELTYLLPKEGSKKIAKLLKILEEDQKEYGLEGFSVSVTTMEEVFIKVLENGDSIEYNKNFKGQTIVGRKSSPLQLATAEEFNEDYYSVIDNNPHGQIEEEIARDKTFFSKDFTRNNIVKQKLTSFVSLFCKRALNSLRDWKMIIFQLLLPFIFTVLACIAIHNMETKSNSPPLDIDFPSNIITHWESKYVTPVIFNYGEPNKNVTSIWETCVSQILRDDTIIEVLRKPDETFSNLSNFKTVEIESNTTMNDYLLSEAKKNLFRYKRNMLFALEVNVNLNNIEGYFQDEAYHAMPLLMNKINNIRLCYYLSGSDVKYNIPTKSISASSFPSINTVNYPLPWNKNKLLLGINRLNNITLASGIFSNSVAFGVSLMVGTFVIFIITERHCGSKHLQFLSDADPLSFWLTSFLWDIINYLLPVFSVLICLVIFKTEGYYENIRYVLFLLISYFWAMVGIVYSVSLLPIEPSNGYIIITVVNVFTGTISNLLITIMKYPQFGISQYAYDLEWLFYAIFPNFAFAKGLLDIFFNYQGLEICGAIKETYRGNGTEVFCKILKEQNETFPCCLDNCGDLCLFHNEDYLTFGVSGIGRSVVFMFLQGLIGMIILFIYEFFSNNISSLLKRHKVYRQGDFTQLSTHEKKEISVSTTLTMLSDSGPYRENALEVQQDVVDDDVFEEANKTLALMSKVAESDKYALILRNVSKFYNGVAAVDNISLTIKKGECFGLLGVNGAGKTTTFKMLVGEIVMDEGDILINGQKWSKSKSLIGYCPQFDALTDNMTVEETLVFYASLRGIKWSQVAEVVNNLIDKFLLTDHANKKAKNLSGGNKRKLGVAIALVGNPPIVFLDEPTTGMDPAARRKLWNVITAIRETGKTIVLTSHSMEECEALCTRMAIMVNGKFKCLGSSLHLKNKFGGGFTVVIKMKDIKKQGVVRYYMKCLASFIDKMFPGNSLKDHHEGLLHYHIPKCQLVYKNQADNEYMSINSKSGMKDIKQNTATQLTWSSLFQILEKAREPFMIEDYSVAQTTLEELFINFARNQH